MDQRKKNLIYLTGFMGSGKSTIAPILANTLGYDFVDVDQEIEKVTGKKVSELFTDHGEQYFRTIELNILQQISHRESCVVSLGGGTIANDVNLATIKSSGILIYLQADAEHIFQRLKFKNNRPMLWGNDGTLLTDDDLRARIDHLFSSREPYYLQADVIISTGENRVGITIDRIVHSIKQLIP